MDSARVALAHDWLNGMRGGEKCLEVLCELYPQSTVFTLFCEPDKLSRTLAEHAIRTSRVQRFPLARSHYRAYLPFFPAAVETFDLDAFDLVVSTSHCVAKGAPKRRDAVHVCYCFTPMRYAWGFFNEYFGSRDPLTRWALRRVLGRLRDWDLRANERVDRFIAISRHVRERIRRHYGRDADVIYPPVNTAFFTPDAGRERTPTYLLVSALVPYKRVELAVEAFNRSGRPLTVIGDGPDRAALEKKAAPNVRFFGWQSDETLRSHYRSARALVFPGEEDFGIVPVEALACGLPVVAYGKGGILETVEDGRTGVFFGEPTAEALLGALDRFEALRFRPEELTARAARFGRDRFREEIRKALEDSLC